MIIPMPAMATSAPAACTSATGRYCAMRFKCARRGAVTADSRSIAPAAKSATAAMRRIRRTRMRSAATSGAGGHDAPVGHPALSSACTSPALLRPLTSESAVTRRSPKVAVGSAASARIRRTCSSAPVSISMVDSWRWLRNVGGSPRRPRCSCTTSEVAPGQAKNPASRWVSSGTSDPPAMTPATPSWTAARVRSSAFSPSISSCACAIAPVPESPRAHGAGRLPPPSARQMPRDVMATTTARTTNSATAITAVSTTRENHDAS